MKSLFKKLFKGGSDAPALADTPAEAPTSAPEPAAARPEIESPIVAPSPAPVVKPLPLPAQTVHLFAHDINELQTLIDACRQRTLIESCAGTSAQGLQYRFQAGPNQDPSTWRAVFLEALAAVPKRLTFPEFERLRGFGEFQKGDRNALGLFVEGTDLIFEFATPPTAGFMHALAQPALARLPSPLMALDQSFQTDSAAPTRFTFAAKNLPDLAEGAHLTAFLGEDLPAPKPGFQRIESSELRIGMVALRPAREMQNQRLRQILIDHIEDVCRRRQHVRPHLFAADGLEIERRTPHPRRLKLMQPLQIALPMADTPAARTMEDIVRQALTELGWAFHMERTRESTSKHDMRLLFEAHSSAFETWHVDFLFHSPFGPQLADPSSRLRVAGRELTDKDYKREVLQALHDDAAVLPLLTCQNAWWVSDDLRIDGLCLERWKVGPAAKE